VALLSAYKKSASGQVAIPLWQLNSSILKEEDRIDFANAIYDAELSRADSMRSGVERNLFVSTPRGLFIINERGKIIQANGVRGVFVNLQKIGKQAFVTTSESSWFVSVDGNTTPVIGLEGRVYSAGTVGGKVFAATENGFFIIRTDGRATQLESIEGKLNVITLIGSRLWVGTNKGLFIVGETETPIRVEGVKRNVVAIVAFGAQAFIGTPEGVFIVRADGTTTPPVEIFFNVAVEVSDHLFLATDKGLIIIDHDGLAVHVRDVKGNQIGIGAIGGKALVDTPEGSWIVNVDGATTRVNGLDGHINMTEEVGEVLFVGTDKGLSVIDRNGAVTQFKEIQCNVSYLALEGDQVFVGTPCQGIWILNSHGERLKRLQISLPEVYNIASVGEYTFIYSSYGLYRLDSNTRISAKLVPGSWWARAMGHILPSKWLPSERVQARAAYSDVNGKDPYDATVPRKFRFAEASDDDVPTYDKFSPQEQFYHDIGWGNNDVHYWVKDQWENTFELRATYYGFPSQYSIAVLPFALSLVFVLGCFALAPKVRFCHSMVMNPWLRKYFSLGSIPLLLSVFPLLRRYILRRYSASINRDKEFAEWRTRFVYPDEEFRPTRLGKRIESERKLLLTGQSGLGKTSFFKHLTAYYAAADGPTVPPKVFPVYISLTHYGGNSLEDLVYNQLFSHGTITDRELAPMFLEQGGLLIFLDGVNEVQNVADRQRLSEFVERFWTSNYLFLSSQQGYPEIENITKVELKTFSAPTICEFIKQRVVNQEVAENVMKSLSNEDYQLYSVPRDLEFGVEILNNGNRALPKSRTDLYETTFRNIFAKWKEKGHMDAEDSLCEHAYMMIALRDSAFDSVENSRFKQVTTDLFERKFLIRLENSYYFRHELIRSYLASKYFFLRWSNLLSGLSVKSVDINWLEMLKFSCENIKDSDEVKALVYEVLKRSVRKDVVRDLFEWLRANQSDKCKSWEREFYAMYGQLDFK